MSLQASTAAFEVRGLTPIERLVLLAYADHCDPEGKCWPSQGRVAERLEVSRETVNRATKSMEAKGMLRLIARKNAAGGRSSNEVHLSQTLLNRAVTIDHRGCDPGSQGVCVPITPPVTEDHIESPNESPNESVPPQPPKGGSGRGGLVRDSEGSDPPKKKRGKKPWQPGPIQKRINALFRRRDTTRWSDKELRAARKIEFEEEDLQAIEKYYQAPADEMERDIRRRDIQTLLNNWPGEVDRARAWELGGNRPVPKKINGNQVARANPQPERRKNWDDYAKPRTTES